MLSLPTSVTDKIVEAAKRSVPVSRIFLFGSYARGDAREDSDADFYVITRDTNTGRNIDDSISISLAAFPLGMPFDLICSRESEFEARSKQFGSLEWNVAQEGVKVYG